MQIISYNKSELQQFIESDFFKKLNKIPISKHRALSHINNPYCADDDILLWAAYENETLLCYASVLPDMLERDSRREKIYWSSSVWREESVQKTTLAAILLHKTLKQYKRQFFITDFIPEAEKAYQKLRIFQSMTTATGVTFYRNLAFSQIIKRRFPKLKPVVPIYLFLERCFNFILFTSRKLTNKKLKPDSKMIENNIFDTEFDNFIKNYCTENQLIERNSQYFNWIIKYPWVLQGKSDNESRRYHFSSVATQFEYHPVKIYDKQQLVGFLFVKIRDKCLTVSFSYLNESYAEDAANYILQLSKTKNSDAVILFDKKIIDAFIKKRTKYIFAKKTVKKYFFPCNFDINLSAFQQGDGDMVFT